MRGNLRAGVMENKSCIVEGRHYLVDASASTSGYMRLQIANFGDRCVAVGDLYAEWRPISIKISSKNANTGSNWAFGHFFPDAVAAYPTTFEELVDTPAFAVGNGAFGAPLPVLHLDGKYWKSLPTNWLTTSSTPTDALLENAGVIAYVNESVAFNSTNCRFLVEWVFEFRCMLDPSVSAERIIARREQLEEEAKEQFPPLCSSVAPSEKKQPVPLPVEVQTPPPSPALRRGWVTLGRPFQ